MNTPIINGTYPATSHDDFYNLSLPSSGNVFIEVAQDSGYSAVYDKNLNYIADISPGPMYLEAGSYIVHAAYLSPTYGTLSFIGDSINSPFHPSNDETFIAKPGDETLDGGAGIDTAVYSGDQSSYTLTLSPTSTTITDRRSDSNGTDTLIDIEFLSFDSGTFDPFDLDTFGGPAGLDPVELDSFVELYIAYFNRAPDAIGLNFWGTQFANGTTLEEMATLFVDQDETLAAYPLGTSNSVFAETVYDNVLGRSPDQSGIDFWVAKLDQGDVGRDQFILNVLQGAKSDLKPELGQDFLDQQLADRTYLENKVDIGAYFAVHKGMSDVDNAADAMAIFGDQDTSNVSGAAAAIDNFYNDALAPNDGEFLMPLVGVLDDPFAVA